VPEAGSAPDPLRPAEDDTFTMANTTGSDRTKTDKERSKQMSRPVTSNQPRGAGRQGGQGGGGPRRNNARPGGPPNRGGGGGGGGGRRTPSRPSPSSPSRRSPTALLTWGTATLVLVIVVVLVVVKILGGGNSLSNGQIKGFQAASPAVVAQVTGIPASVFDDVGINAEVAAINPPILITGQKPLTFTSADGTSLPGVYFYGAEYCPYCAAARWSIIAALSRFGTFKKLGNMESSSSDIDPSTQTFTFVQAKYSSPYIVFKPEEYYSNQVNSAGTGYTIANPPTATEAHLVTTYDTSKYFPETLAEGESGFPFIDFGNKILQDTLYDPSILQGLTRGEIASGLNDAKNPITQVIVAGANYFSASVCNIDGQMPASVCTSKGVTAAAKALKLS
jgi:hypothetical protein